MDILNGNKGKIEKLMIIPLEDNNSEKEVLDTKNALICQFNPERITLGKNNSFRFRNDMGSDVPEVIFSGGMSSTIEVDLLFDSTDQYAGEPKDVRKMYEKLIEMVHVRKGSSEGEYSEPPYVRVVWGKFISFRCVVDSVHEEFELFAHNGVPLRANLRVCFKQSFDDNVKGGTNPTSRSEARRTWVVERGQRLDWIAYQAYGESSAWRHIAETNGILDPTRLTPGQILKLTPLT